MSLRNPEVLILPLYAEARRDVGGGRLAERQRAVAVIREFLPSMMRRNETPQAVYRTLKQLIENDKLVYDPDTDIFSAIKEATHVYD